MGGPGEITTDDTPMIQAVTTVGLMVPTRGVHNQLPQFRVGQFIEAQVDSIGESGVARLVVAGMTIHVTLPEKLFPGTMITLLVKQGTDSGLILELKRPESLGHSTQPAKAHRSAPPATARGVGLLSALLDIGTALSAARSGLAAGAGVGSTDPTSLDRSVSAPVDGASEAGTSAAQYMHSDAEVDTRQIAIARPHSLPAQTEAEEFPNASDAGTDAKMPIRGIPDQSIAPQSTVINYSFPGATERLQIAITRSDEVNEYSNNKHSDYARTSIEARFSIDSETLGRVHVVMRQLGSAISVGLWAERHEVAAELFQERAELQDALGAADLEVDALEIFAGSPSAAASRAVTPTGNVVP